MLSVTQQTYTILKPLGKGEYGLVHEVQNQDGGRFALKQYFPEDGGIPLGALREISVLKQLQKLNPYPQNLIKLHDIITTSDFIAIVIPLYHTTLISAIRGNMISLEQKNHICLGVLTGLMWLMTCEILHRDIKPDNIMLDDAMNPVIIDFSIANNRTITENVCSFAYRPPEIFDKQPYTFALDMWSFGIMMLEMYTKKFIRFNTRTEIMDYIHYAKDKTVEGSYFFLVKDILVQDPTERFTPFQCISLLRPQYTFPCIPKSMFKGGEKVSEQIKSICDDYSISDQQTKIAAQIYLNIMDSTYSQLVVILAAKFYEKEPLEISGNFYKEEMEVFRKRNYNLFI